MQLALLLLAYGMTCLGGTVPSHQRNKRYMTSQNGIDYDVFEHGATGTKLSFVTNSGICETTPGVNQYSGYLTVGEDSSQGNIFFWFFESRISPTTAPLSLWLNGGPGCSSLLGLFHENGPCQFADGSSTPSLNPNSWNSVANVLYVDQPIGAGLSYGTDNVTSTVAAAPYLWKFLQAFYDGFPAYGNRDFGLFTESYGGHFGPEFASYFQDQNAAISSGTITGQNINLVALGINNGWFDPMQYKSYLDFAVNNDHRQLITEEQFDQYLSEYESECVPAATQCNSTTGSDEACSLADVACFSVTESPIEWDNDFDVYDIRTPADNANAPKAYASFLQDEAIASAIGAQKSFEECSPDLFSIFSDTGDSARSFLPALSKVVQSGVTVLIWAGDTDWVCNWPGVLAVANSIDYPGKEEFASKEVEPYTVDGVQKGEFKTVGNLSWLKVFEAGHQVPFYQPEVSLQAFWQTLQKQPLSST